MGSIQTGIVLQDNFTNVLYSVINSTNAAISVMNNMQRVMSSQIDTSGISEVTSAVEEMNNALNNTEPPVISPIVEQIDLTAIGEELTQTDVAVTPVITEQPQIEIPEEITIPVEPVVAEQPQIDAPEDITIPVTPAITEQPQIEIPEEITIPVEPVVAEQPQIDVPEDITIPVTPVITEQPQIEVPDEIAVPVDVEMSGAEKAEQRITELTERLHGVMDMQNAINSVSSNLYILPENAQEDINNVNREITQMQQAIEYLRTNPFELDSSIAELQIQSISDALDGAIERQQRLNEQMGNAPSQIMNTVPEPVEVPVQWQTDELEIFTNSGVERFEQEIWSANHMLSNLNITQRQIQQTANGTDIFPDTAMQDISAMGQRIREIQARILQISGNPMNIGTDAANNGMEQLRAQLNQAVQEQQQLNTAVQNMDVSAANSAYRNLSQTVSGTERYIRDNVDEQGRFNRTIDQGTNSASELKSMISKAVGAFAGIFGINQVISFVSDSMDLFNTQLNSETQLMSVLANMLDDDYVSNYVVETTVNADTSDAISEINDIQNNVDDVEITVQARTDALQAEFDAITAKASEIQSKGIYGDEAMIAGAAELSTYFTDTDAIEMMMDTLSNYAMGMSGGGELDANAMVDYATGLGKIMSGSYEAMTKKGFEFTDTQKAIIEGTATEEQVAAQLGSEYVNMSEDMQSAAAITQVIDESWAGLYETMSDTPQGKIIQMTNSWGDMREVIGSQLYPYLILFVDTITENWGAIQTAVNGFVVGLQDIMLILDWLVQGAINLASAIVDNWSSIAPVVYGIVGALGVYVAYLAVAKTAEMAAKSVKMLLTIAQYAHAAATRTAVSATTAETAAQTGLNTALLSCPLTWIIVLVLALIGVVYAAVAAVNKFAGTSTSATGIICGAFMAAAAFIGNLFITLVNRVIDTVVVLWNFIAAFANFFANVFTDPVGSIAQLFFDLVDTILSLLESLASAIDTIFGSNLTSSVSGWRDSLGSWVDETFGEGEEIMAEVNSEDYHLERFEYGSAFESGYDFGEGIDESIEDFDLSSLLDPSSLADTLGIDVGNASDYQVKASDYTSALDNLDDISSDTSDISDSLDITDEELKYLRDIAEQEAINRFTTAEISVDMSGMQNTVNSGDDIDGFITKLTDSVNEAVDSMTEGVHT